MVTEHTEKLEKNFPTWNALLSACLTRALNIEWNEEVPIYTWTGRSTSFRMSYNGLKNLMFSPSRKICSIFQASNSATTKACKRYSAWIENEIKVVRLDIIINHEYHAGVHLSALNVFVRRLVNIHIEKSVFGSVNQSIHEKRWDTTVNSVVNLILRVNYLLYNFTLEQVSLVTLVEQVSSWCDSMTRNMGLYGIEITQ